MEQFTCRHKKGKRRWGGLGQNCPPRPSLNYYCNGLSSHGSAPPYGRDGTEIFFPLKAELSVDPYAHVRDGRTDEQTPDRRRELVIGAF